MASRRIVEAAASQAALFACGVGLTLALQARFPAVATVLGLAAVWIAAAMVSASHPGGAGLVETPRQIARDTAQARLLASLLDQTPAPLLTLGPGGVVQARNRVARQLFGVDGPIAQPSASLRQALDTPQGGGRITTAVQGRTYAVSLSDVSAEAEGLRLAVLLDIEPELRAAEATALRELMQVLGHEIMNGLTPVASLAATAHDLLAEGNAAAIAQARDALGVLARRAEGLARFAESYRTLARLPPPTCTPTSLASLIEEVAELFRSRWAKAGVTLAAQTPNPDMRFALDRDQVVHALANLLANAAEAALAAKRPPHVRLWTQARERGIALVVADSGEGVSALAREHLFQPFFTTKPSGTGVGLSLARQVARAHGGELELRCIEPGSGAVFELRLG